MDETKIAQARAERMRQTQSIGRNLLARCYEGTASPRQAIRAFCTACVGERRKDVSDCTAYGCPLWTYRPYQDHGDGAGSHQNDAESPETGVDRGR